MNLRLKAAALLGGFGFMRSRGLVELSRLTADAFGAEYPFSKKSSSLSLLHRYGQFTKREAEKALASGEPVQMIRERLRDNACRFGREIRRRLRLDSPEEVMAAARLLYRQIKIDLRGTPRGEIVIRKCFFSAYYSPRVCDLVSALDEGILAGLAGGGELRFLLRISEGNDSCRARFLFTGMSR